MELYEYKLAAMKHSECAATVSVEAASQRCTHLLHQAAQLTTELSRLHQLLLYAEQRREDTVKAKDLILLKNQQLQEWSVTTLSYYPFFQSNLNLGTIRKKLNI